MNGSRELMNESVDIGDDRQVGERKERLRRQDLNDGEAFKLLMEKKEFHWAAVANYINGDEGAMVFLKRNKLEHYGELANLVQAKIRREGDEGTSIFSSGPFRIDRD